VSESFAPAANSLPFLLMRKAQMRFPRLALSTVVSFLLCIVPVVVNATQTPIVVYTFSGEIAAVDAALGSTFAVGRSASLTLTIDVNEADVSTNPKFGRYQDLSIIGANIDGYSFGGPSSPPTPFIDVFNDLGGGLTDSVDFNIGAIVGSPVAGLPLLNSTITLLDSTGTVFNDNRLPTSFTLNDFDGTSWRLNFQVADPITGGTIGVESVFVSIRDIGIAVSVPESGTLPLVALGLAVILQRAKRFGHHQVRG
jgi:hypothetical protein